MISPSLPLWIKCHDKGCWFGEQCEKELGKCILIRNNAGQLHSVEKTCGVEVPAGCELAISYPTRMSHGEQPAKAVSCPSGEGGD